MAQGARPDRVGEEIRQQLAMLLLREVHDPGVGFVTITRVKVSPDLQIARIYYTLMGDERARRDAQRGLERATPFLRRQIGSRIRLRRVPELRFHFDEGIENQDRVERILQELAEERKARGEIEPAPDAGDGSDPVGPVDPEHGGSDGLADDDGLAGDNGDDDGGDR